MGRFFIYTRTFIAALVIAAVPGLAAQSASASQRVPTGTHVDWDLNYYLQIKAAPGKDNVIYIHGIIFEDGHGIVHIYDDGDEVTGPLGNRDINIPADADVFRVNVDAGDGNDRVYNFTELKPTLHGGPGNDYLYSGSTADKMWGDDGDDRLDSRSHADQLFGGNGNDTLDGGDDNDSADGGAGNDTCINVEAPLFCE
ncbi:calcium-binding protein [Streptomyces sp. SJL17-4]|uniref:calcium-binding protein n=1 Tax=Streptomyces sp. SJL17-4 TaxID=2967224 RepID=UPI0030CFD977